MKFLGMGMPELLIILAVILLIFGPKNLPKLGASLGKTVKNIREGMNGDSSSKKKKANEIEEADDEDLVDDGEEDDDEVVEQPKRRAKKKPAAEGDEDEA